MVIFSLLVETIVLTDSDASHGDLGEASGEIADR